jgi:hypothetical protein
MQKKRQSHAYAPKVMGREFFEQAVTCSCRTCTTVKSGPGGI